MKLLNSLALFVLLCICCAFAWKLCDVADHVNESLDRVDGAVFAASSQVSEVTGSATGAINQFSSVGVEAQGLIHDSRRPIAKILVHADDFMGRGARAMGKIEASASDLHDQQQIINAQELELFARTSSLMSDADQAIISMKHSSDDFGDLVSDPHIVGTLANFDGITGDARTKFHDILFPQPYSGRFKTLHRALTVGRGVLQIAGPGAEFSYYLSNIR